MGPVLVRCSSYEADYLSLDGVVAAKSFQEISVIRIKYNGGDDTNNHQHSVRGFTTSVPVRCRCGASIAVACG